MIGDDLPALIRDGYDEASSAKESRLTICESWATRLKP